MLTHSNSASKGLASARQPAIAEHYHFSFCEIHMRDIEVVILDIQTAYNTGTCERLNPIEIPASKCDKHPHEPTKNMSCPRLY